MRVHTAFSEVQEAAATLPLSTVSTSFPSPAIFPCIAGNLAPAQHLASSLPSSLPSPVCSPAVPSTPSLLESGYATAEGSPDLVMESYLHPGIAFDSITPFDWTVFAEVALLPQAEPSLITDRDGEGLPALYDASDSFEFISLPSITAGNRAKNDHVEARA